MRRVWFLLALGFVSSKKDPILYCDVCKGVIGELREEISKMPETQKVKVVKSQSRLSGDGSLKEVSKIGKNLKK